MKPAARAYLFGEAVVRRLATPLHPAWSGLWLGLLSRGALHAIDEALYRQRRNYHSAEHNRSGLLPWERTAVDRYFGGVKRIALIGAGGGREVLALWRLGYQPEGFECNADLVAFAAKFLPGEGCPHGVRLLDRDRPPPGGHFDAAIMGWSSYMLIAGRDVRIAFLRGLRPLLPVGAPLLLSFFTRGAQDPRSKRVSRAARAVRRALRRPDPEPGDDMLPAFLHRFTRDEIEAEVEAAGFRLLRYEPQGRGRYDSGWAVAAAT